MKLSGVMLRLILTIFLVISGSFLSVKTWSDKSEEIKKTSKITVTPGMTVGELINTYSIPEKVILKFFGPEKTALMKQPVSDYISENKNLIENLEQSIALYEENQTKNWFKIPLKFMLWFIFMGSVFYMIKTKILNPRRRILLYVSGVIVFGIILGADPSPMGTIKDAIALYGEKHVVFKPRMIALAVFLFTVFAANKMICAWGCQFGMLQDLIFRINRNNDDKKGILKQYKIPFVVTNSIRILFFTIFTITALIWSYDIISDIDPFKIFKPKFLLVPGIIMLTILLIGSIFIYRPWCHLFCPFGLAGWLVEKISIYKIVVDYDKCTTCLACEKACPSTVMSAILRRDKIIPDCFSCGTCINACNFDAVSFTSAKRTKPEADFFT
ncbi:MAG: 4Fe-4S ferredoxin [Spirochaetae bacterium HGW-Spirochaetae-5]|nr:MAG: 4Fe-4S ferredoxin [Spirochaetae bacterium HGW-Spirochaetae-5]